MATGNQTNTANITILATEDSTGNVLVNRTFAPSLDCNAGIFNTYMLTPQALPLVLATPTTETANFSNVYVRNTSGAGGGNVQISVTWTSSPAALVTLKPGDVFLYWGTSESSPLTGITSIVAEVVSGSNATLEYFIGG